MYFKENKDKWKQKKDNKRIKNKENKDLWKHTFKSFILTLVRCCNFI